MSINVRLLRSTGTHNVLFSVYVPGVISKRLHRSTESLTVQLSMFLVLFLKG